MDQDEIKRLEQRPPWPDSGHPRIDEVFAAVGRCLTEWEAYEAVLAIVYARLVANGDETPAKLSFGAVRTFEGRLGLLRMAYKGFVMNRDIKIQDIEDTIKIASLFAARRNDIAHGAVRNCCLARPDKYQEPESYCLFSGYADSVKMEKVTLSLAGGNWSANTYMPSYAYSISQMNRIASAFKHLQGEAGRVSRGVSLYIQNGKYPEPGTWQ